MGSGQATPIRVLHVDDDPAFLDLVAEYLERESDALTVVSATDPDDALAALDDVDCVVSDYEMPGMDGLELLAAVRGRYSDLPFILFTGVGSEHLASDAIAAGVTDYFRKENGPEQYAVLARRITNAVERRRVEREVRRREASLANAQRIANIGNWDWNLRTDDLRWSDEIYRLFGVEPGAFEETFQAFMRFVHPADRPVVEAAVEEALAGSDGETYGVDHRVVRPDGEVRYVHEQGEVVVEDGTAVAMSGVVHDITERKEHEQALERYETIVEAVGDPVYALDPSGRFTFVNDAFVRVTGYGEDELVGEDVSVVMDPADVETAESLIRELLSDPDRSTATFELEVETADGDRIHGENQMALLPFEEAFRGTAGVVRDITERKRMAAALEAERDRFRALFENIPDPTVDVEFVDGEPVVRAVNAAFEQVFGHDGASAVGEHLDDLVVPDARRPQAEQISHTVLDEETAYDAEVRRQTTTGLRDFLLRIAPIDADGDRYYGIYTDITARMERERAITRQNERLEEFARVVSHDVRNPLNVAEGRLDLYRETGEEAHLDAVEDAHDRMETIIEDVLSLARQGLGVDDPEPTDLESVAADAWASVDTKDAVLSVEGTRTVAADTGRFQQLLENLFRNAVEHAGRDVTVRVGPLDDGFFVADDGPGVPEDDRDSVFVPGYSTASDGTGFGLSIVRQIAEAHGWTVEVTESETGGARFEVTDVS